MSKRFAAICLRWAVITVVVTSLLCLAPLLDNGFRYEFWQNAALAASVAALGGILSAGLLYLGYYFKSLRSLKVAEQELGATEKILKQTLASILHYRTGRPWRIWEAVGGKLFVTSSRLIFRAHAGQPWRYEISIPLAELAGATPCRIMGLPNGLAVESIDGTKELFGCGMESAEEWASAITVVRTMGPMVEGRPAFDSLDQGVVGNREPPADSDDGYKQGSTTDYA